MTDIAPAITEADRAFQAYHEAQRLYEAGWPRYEADRLHAVWQAKRRALAAYVLGLPASPDSGA